MKKLASLVCALSAFALTLTGCGKTAGSNSENSGSTSESVVETAFTPRLDVSAKTDINVASFFGNFEALIEVANHFNEFYPNVEIQISGNTNAYMPNFWENNPQFDIFMTSNEKGYEIERCVDLLEEGVNVAAIDDKVIEANKREGKLYSIPMSLNLKGMVVNKTLLQKEGLKVPETWSEFVSACETLKQKGYTPVQGPDTYVAASYSAIGTIAYNMGMTMLASDPALFNAVNSNDKEGAAKLNLIYDRLNALVSNGYVNGEVNATYPANNYDKAILKFFEGDVPFWVCDTEKVSGMKKRETKSEAFKENPFEYEFDFIPLGDNGAYEYIEPWYGFAVNKYSERKDYAIEFMRFMARSDEMNTLAEIKGVPSVAKVSSDTRYVNLSGMKKEIAVVSDGKISAWYGSSICEVSDGILGGTILSADDALQNYLSRFIPEN